jgi:DNA-binding GntR family transcriptional regulator
MSRQRPQEIEEIDRPVPAEEQKIDPVHRLREAIISGRFMPNERLIELQLVNFLSTNRANVRTALARLEQEGLVVIEPNRGARVRLVSDVEALEITQARGVLEGLVARQAAERITEKGRRSLRKILAEMQALFDRGDLIGYSTVNGQLHSEIQRISGNATATRILENLESQVIRFQYRTILIAGRAAQSLQEHKDIVEAICSGDGGKAEQIMRRHLDQIERALKATIDKAGR